MSAQRERDRERDRQRERERERERDREIDRQRERERERETEKETDRERERDKNLATRIDDFTLAVVHEIEYRINILEHLLRSERPVCVFQRTCVCVHER